MTISSLIVLLLISINIDHVMVNKEVVESRFYKFALLRELHLLKEAEFHGCLITVSSCCYLNSLKSFPNPLWAT